MSQNPYESPTHCEPANSSVVWASLVAMGMLIAVGPLTLAFALAVNKPLGDFGCLAVGFCTFAWWITVFEIAISVRPSIQ